MILVTGGTGLVGAHLLQRLLETEDSIRAVYRSESSLENTKRIFGYTMDKPLEEFERIDWVKCDLFDVTDLDRAMEGVNLVYHCAAVVSFQPKDKQKVLEGNPLMTRSLINAALAANVETFIHVSSVSAIGRAPEGEMTHEDIEWKDSPTTSTYSKSKYAAELEAWRGAEEGINIGIVNPVIILGPGNWKMSSAKIFDTFYNGFRFYTSGLGGFVDVEDVVEAMLQIVKRKKFSRRYILVGENLKFKTLFDWITSEYGKKAPDILPPSWLMEFFWRAEWLRAKLTGSTPLVTKETTRQGNSVHYFDNTRAREELGIEFTPIRKSVKKYCAMYLEDKRIDE